MDLLNPTYRRYSERIIRKMMEHYAQHPAIIGTVPSTDLLYQLIARAADRKGIATVERQYQFPIVLRSGINAKGGKLHYLFNYSYEPKTVAYPYPASRSLLDSQKLTQGQDITIEPWGVVIGEERREDIY